MLVGVARGDTSHGVVETGATAADLGVVKTYKVFRNFIGFTAVVAVMLQ